MKYNKLWASQVALVVMPANAGDLRDVGLIPGWGRSPGGAHGNPLQDSYLKRPMDRGAWRATDHRVTKSGTRLKRLSSSSCHIVSGVAGVTSTTQWMWRQYNFWGKIIKGLRASALVSWTLGSCVLGEASDQTVTLKYWQADSFTTELPRKPI